MAWLERRLGPAAREKLERFYSGFRILHAAHAVLPAGLDISSSFF